MKNITIFLIVCLLGINTFASIFSDPVPLSELTYGEAVDAADFDNDGWVDAVVSTSQNRSDVLYKNNKDGTFTPILLPGLTTAFGVKCGDLNNDGKIDIVATNSSGVPNVIYKNNGNWSFTKTNVCNVATSTTDVDICDLNNDGLNDLVFSTASGAGSADLIAWNLGDLQFVYEALPGVSLADTIVCADIDGDSDPDIAVGCRGGAYVYENKNGFFLQRNLGSVASISGLAKGQLDQYAGEEVVSSTYNSDNYDLIIKKTGVSSQPFQIVPMQIQAGVSSRDSTSIGDLDLDGDQDIYMSVHKGSDFLYMNVSENQLDFLRMSIPSSTADKNGVCLADFDRDGDLDAFISTSGTGGAYDYVSWNATVFRGQDTDSDGMTDIYEIKTGLDRDTNDANGDLDGDGKSNYSEFVFGTNPSVMDDQQVHLMTSNTSLFFDAIATSGEEYIGTTRLFTVEYKDDMVSTWAPLPNYVDIVGANQRVYIIPKDVKRSFYRLKMVISF